MPCNETILLFSYTRKPRNMLSYLTFAFIARKCSTTYSRTWVGGGRGPRRVEGGIGVPGIGGSAPAQKIRYMCTLCIHLFCLYPNAPRCRHDALPNGALTHHILQETPTLDAHSHTCANVCLLPCGLQHGALSRLSYRRDF